MTGADQNSFLSEEVRRYDYDRWLTALFAPAPVRSAYLALLAYHSELARIRETVSEPMLGDIRLQWWRDALGNMEAGGAVPVHPVAEALAETLSAHDLSVADLREMIDARACDLDPLPFQTVVQLLDYAGRTGGVLQRLLHRISGGETAEGGAAAYQVGKAYALCGIIRGIPYHVAQDVLRVPEEMITAKGLTAATLFSKGNRQHFFEIARELTELASAEQEIAVRLVKARPRSEKAAYRLASLTSLYLRRLTASGHDPAHLKMDIGPVRKIAALSLGR